MAQSLTNAGGRVAQVNFAATNLRLEWIRFKREFEFYIVVGELDKKSDLIKIGLLMLLIGSEGADKFDTFNLSDLDKVIYAKVITAYDSYFSPKGNLYVERISFFARIQLEHEPIEQFIGDVRKLASTCEFINADEMIRDRIVIGLWDRKVRDKVIFAEIKELATVIEKIRIYNVNSQKLKSADSKPTSTSIDRVVNDKSSTITNNRGAAASFKHGGSSQQGPKCNRCNFVHYTSSQRCPAASKVCDKCGKVGHFAVCCKSGKRVDVVEEYFHEPKGEVMNFDVVERFVDNNMKWYKSLDIDNTTIRFKLDTGAQINTISESDAQVFKEKHKIEKCNIRLQAYFGDIRLPLGQIILPVSFKDKIYHERFIIIEGVREPLLGLSTCIKMNLVKRLDTIKSSSENKFENYFIEEFKQTFQGIGKFGKPAKLLLKDRVVPVAAHARRIPLKLKEKVIKKLTEMENDKIISKVNEPREWINNVVVVEKGDKIRICIDPKHLNESLRNFRYPIPSLEELKLDFKDAEYFTVLDLKDGFYHVELEEKSRKLCTFSTPYGLYQFNRLPFGIKIASELFQKYMNETFGDLPGVKFYIDDSVIYGKDLREHDVNLRRFMSRAVEKGVKFNLKKLQFTKKEVKFFGHIFSKNEVRVDLDRIKSITNLPVPTSQKEVQKFLGVVNYIREFIPNLPVLTHNIRNLLKKDSAFVWLANHQAEFDKLKEAIGAAACCTTYDELIPLELETDASSYGLGACLKQNGKIISYASRCLSETEQQYGQIEKEFLAVFFGCQKFHNYIYGREVVVKSDHKPLESIMLKDLSKIGSRRLQRLRLKLYKYNLKLDYKPGTKIPIADYLSRFVSETVDENFEEKVMTQMVHSLHVNDNKLSTLLHETNEDIELLSLKKYFNDGWPSDKSKVREEVKHYYKIRNEIYVSQGLVFYQDRLIIPKSMQLQVLNDLHISHMGITKTLKLAKESVFWPSMAQSIENLVSKCEMCNKFQKSNKKEPIIQHEIPEFAFEKIACDILEFEGKNFLVAIDYFSKWICCKQISSKNSATIISKWIEIFTTHGFPLVIISDNMPFSSYECKSFAEEFDIKIVTSSPHYPQSNGLAEKSVGIVKAMIKKCKNMNDLHIAIMHYNNTPLADLNLSPSQLAQNRRMRTNIVTKSELLEPKLNTNVKQKIQLKNSKSASYYNRNVIKRDEFKVSQQVWLQKPDKTWQKGIVVGKLSQPRSYAVKLENGSILRRNSKFLRQNKGVPISNSNSSNESPSSYKLDPGLIINNTHQPSTTQTATTPPQQQTTIQPPVVQQLPQSDMSSSTPHTVTTTPVRRSSRIPKAVKRYGQS